MDASKNHLTRSIVSWVFLLILTQISYAESIKTTTPPDDSWLSDANGCKIINTAHTTANTVQWSGTCLDGLATGMGTVTIQTPNKPDLIIQGTLINGIMTGNEIISLPNGEHITGIFANNGLTGTGTVMYPNGTRYIGDLENGIANGTGTYFYPDGYFTGTFVQGQPDGQGTMTYRTGGSETQYYHQGMRDFQNESLDASEHEEVLYIPLSHNPNIKLQVTLFKPAGHGPFPLAIINHGLNAIPATMEPRYRGGWLTNYFLSRGYAVILPMLRSFAGSQGENLVSCDPAAMLQANDLHDVIDALSTPPFNDPRIDTTRIIVAGGSYGGLNTLALGSLNLPNIKGLLNFAGGSSAMGGIAIKGTPICDPRDKLPQAMRTFGATTHIPSLWFYGTNDNLFPSVLWQSMYSHYTAAGGKAKLICYGNFKQNAHLMLGDQEGLSIWVSSVDQFLSQLGLPHDNIHPEFMSNVSSTNSQPAQCDQE